MKTLVVLSLHFDLRPTPLKTNLIMDVNFDYMLHRDACLQVPLLWPELLTNHISFGYTPPPPDTQADVCDYGVRHKQQPNLCCGAMLCQNLVKVRVIAAAHSTFSSISLWMKWPRELLMIHFVCLHIHYFTCN